jgi:uncharacterized membrane protein YfcA
MPLVAVPLGIALGLSVGALGAGGSVLAVPLFVYALGLSVHEATTASLVVVAAAAFSAGVGHGRAGRVCWRHAAAFSVAAIPGIVAGTIAGDRVSDRVLIGAFVPIMLGSAAMLWRTAGGRGEECAAPRCPPLQLPVALVAGAGIGTVTGFLGVGGGFLIVPTLVVALALKMRLAVGTSLAIIAGTSLFGLVTHLGAGRELDVGATVALSLGCVAGALAGCRLCGRIPAARLARGFALLVCAVAAYLFASAAFLGVPG